MISSETYQDLVQLKYQLYNSLFLTLPFSPLGHYGPQLPLFAQKCREQLEEGRIPSEIIAEFCEEQKDSDSLLFLFLQLIERQVLLFDAIESAAHPEMYQAHSEHLQEQLLEELHPGKTIRLVLTAHPTQFYPESLLGIIEDLSKGVHKNDAGEIRKTLLQLGYTSFRNAEAPTPLSEAEMLINRFGRLFYSVFLDIVMQWSEQTENAPRLELGFWPGGDRDGHPYVTVETTRKVAERLRSFATGQLLRELCTLKRRITFKGAIEQVNRLYADLSDDKLSLSSLKEALQQLLEYVDTNHQGLFREKVLRVITALDLFGYHFASLDLRQSSDVCGGTVRALGGGASRGDLIALLDAPVPEIPDSLGDRQRDLVEVLKAVPEIQQRNGPEGLHRFVISHAESVEHVLEVLVLSRWFAENSLDIVPLFESIQDLQNGPSVIEELLQLPEYVEHLRRRGNQQTVMLGFSDGTKDGGYVTCNWEIHRCKQRLQEVAERYGIEVIFFDGRGGPPARGGGSTHRYYKAVAERVSLDHIQLTVQGQSISSYYGTYASGRENLLQLLSAFRQEAGAVPENEDELLSELSERAFSHYQALRQDPDFLPLLEEATPMSLLGDLNIASRPPKRKEKGEWTLDNLRAISFVGSWSLMKLNVPAYYGLGLALNEMRGKLDELYASSTFFQMLLGNAQQALRKSYPALTQYLADDVRFGKLWSGLQQEAVRSRQQIQALSKQEGLKLEDPLVEASVSLREQIILPLLVIQHHALKRWREQPDADTPRKMLLKSIPPSINAGRNSA